MKALRRKGFTLVEIMIVVAIIGIIISIAIPAFLRARENARGRACQENLQKVDGSKEQWALDFRQSNGATVAIGDLIGTTLYLKRTPLCPSGGTYTVNAVGTDPACSIGTTNTPYVPHTLPDSNTFNG